MKHSLFAGFLALVAAALFTGCGESSPEASTDTAAARPYPLDVCIVSDEKLGSMGDPVVQVVNGQEVKFCCKSCVPDFEKDQAKFLAKLAGK